MYLRKTAMPRTITLPDGSILSLADLPPPDTRWVASRKALVCQAVLGGLLTREEALQRYQLSSEELDSWCSAVNNHGVEGLKVTSLQKYRQPKID